MDYVRRFLYAESAEATLGLDPGTGSPTGITGKITFGEPSPAQRSTGSLSVDDLMSSQT